MITLLVEVKVVVLLIYDCNDVYIGEQIILPCNKKNNRHFTVDEENEENVMILDDILFVSI